MPVAHPLALVTNVDDIGNPDAAMTATGKPTKREHLVLTQPIDILTRDPENPSSLGGRHLLLATEQNDVLARRHVIQHRSYEAADCCRRIDTLCHR